MKSISFADSCVDNIADVIYRNGKFEISWDLQDMEDWETKVEICDDVESTAKTLNEVITIERGNNTRIEANEVIEWLEWLKD